MGLIEAACTHQGNEVFSVRSLNVVLLFFSGVLDWFVCGFAFFIFEVMKSLVLKNVVSLNDFISLKKLSGHGVVFLLKHSVTSPVSDGAFRVFSGFSEKHGDVPCFVLRVQDAKNVSDRVSVDSGVKHESPQVLLFRKGEVVWSASNLGISLVALENAFRKFKA